MSEHNISLSADDLASNLQGQLSATQARRLQGEFVIRLLGVLGLVLLGAGMVGVILTKTYPLLLLLAFWAFLLRNAPRNLLRIQRDLQAREVDYIEGVVQPRMHFTPGVIRMANPHLHIDAFDFSVNEDTFYQVRPMEKYRVYYTRHAQVWLGAVPLADQAMPNSDLLAQFNPRELEILKLMEGGLSNQEIANTLYLSVNTVKMYTSQIYKKLNVQRRTEAIAHARSLGLL